MHSVSSTDVKQKKKGLEVLLGAIDRRIHRAIELDQLIALTAELAIDRLQKVPLLDSQKIMEDLEYVVSRSEEHCDILRDTRKILKDELSTSTKYNVE